MPDRLVHIVDDVPELDDLSALTMVLVLDGFLDAGNAASRAVQHLVDLSDGRVVATFDVDELHDYRARRPPMSFVRDHYDALRRPAAGRPAARTTPAARRTCCSTAPSRTPAGRRSARRCARWSSASA